MKRLRLIGAAALLACASSAFASSFVVTTDTLVRATGMTSNATSDITNSVRDDKIVLEAPARATSAVRTWKPHCATSVASCRAWPPTTCNWPRRS